VRRLDEVVAGRRPPGVYRWLSRAHPAAVRRELAAEGWQCHVLDGTRIADAPSLFDASARALSLPGWFRPGWDDLALCLADLSWLPGPGHVLVWDRYGVLARHDAQAWSTAHGVLRGAVAARQGCGAPPLYVLLRGSGPTDLLPVL